MNKNLCLGYVFGIIITILIVIAIFSWSYNDDVEKEYFSNYERLDKIVREMD